jgi:predicted RNase H-like nuclease
MFGKKAPLWPFLRKFGGAANPRGRIDIGSRVFETYPVLAMIALGWTLPDRTRPSGRLPKYNPMRKKTFSRKDWQYLCGRVSRALRKHGLLDLPRWIDTVSRKALPAKVDQDGLDACLCLLVALHMMKAKACLMVGNLQTGYIVVPSSEILSLELEDRCKRIGVEPSRWLQTV